MAQPKIDHIVRFAEDRIQQVTIDGVPCYAFTVKPGDVLDFDRVEGNRGPNGQFNERAEISAAPAQGTQKYKGPYNVREGMLQTYDVDYRFATGFPAHVSARHEWAVLTQYHPQDDTKSSFKGFGGATVHDGAITFENPSVDGSYFAKMPITADGKTKHQIRMIVKWTAGKDGFAKVIDRATGKLLGRYDGPTLAPGEFKYGPMQGYYRAGGLPAATVYQSSPGGPLIDINDGDLSETDAPAPTPPAPEPVTPAPPSPAKPSVDPEAAAVFLMAAVDQLDEIVAGTMRVREAAIAVLDKGPYKPAG